MSPKAATRLIVAQAAAIVALGWAVAYLGQDEFKLAGSRDSETVAAPARVEAKPDSALPAVRLGAAARQAAGIVVEPLRAHTLHRQLPLAATVVDVQPLIELRGRYQAALAEALQARAAAARSGADWRRTQTLFADDRNVSERALEGAEAQAKSDQARLAGAEAAAAGLRATLLHGWGRTLAGWAAAEPSPDFERLARRQDTLLQVTLRPGQTPVSLPKPAPALAVAATAGDAPALSARHVSAAPRADPQFPGETHFYLAPGAGLRAGTRLAAELRSGKAGPPGVVVPAAAVVWHGGKPWVYVEDDKEEDEFVRHPLSVSDPVGADWFDAGLDADDKIVTHGAQLLLSEELRYRIKNENED